MWAKEYTGMAESGLAEVWQLLSDVNGWGPGTRG